MFVRQIGAEAADDFGVDRAFEGDDGIQHLIRQDPAPGAEFGVFGGNLDVAVLALEAEEEPFLLLPAILAAPDAAQKIGRQVIGHPAMGLGDGVHKITCDAGFFHQLTEGGGFRGFALVDPALWHLPGGRGAVEPLAREDHATSVDQDDTGAGAVGQGFGIDGGCGFGHGDRAGVAPPALLYGWSGAMAVRPLMMSTA